MQIKKINSTFVKNIPFRISNTENSFTRPHYKFLKIKGVGFRALKFKNFLFFRLGHSHYSVLSTPNTSLVSIFAKKNKLLLLGVKKDLVSKLSYQIRNFRPADPYKLKGLSFHDEVLEVKAGKQR